MTMRNFTKLVLVAFAFLFVGVWIGRAQSTSPWQVSVSAATHTSCTVTAGLTQFCFASDGLWQSLSGAAYTQIGGGAAGVTSFNGRTGAVLPATGDYSYAQLSAPPTKVNCGATGCVIN